jgi:[ribosomal protein S18]-alanine N-acetyltransferase
MSDPNRTPIKRPPPGQYLPPEVHFRSLTPQDAPELAYCELLIFKHPWSENSLRDCLELVSVEGEAIIVKGKIIGYIIIQTVLDEAHILNIGVLPSYRGHGLGRILLERLLKLAVQLHINIIFLEVRSSNRVAQNLYFSMGFAPISARKKYYPDGEDALILMKKL